MAMLEIIQADSTISIAKTYIKVIEILFCDEWSIILGTSNCEQGYCIGCGVAPCSKEYAHKIYHEILQALKIDRDTSITIDRPVGE